MSEAPIVRPMLQEPWLLTAGVDTLALVPPTAGRVSGGHEFFRRC